MRQDQIFVPMASETFLNPLFFNISISSELILEAIPGPLKTIPVYN